jgi:hypothetical protein
MLATTFRQGNFVPLRYFTYNLSLFLIFLKLPQLSRQELRRTGMGGYNWLDFNLRHKSESCCVKRREQITTGLVEESRRTVHPLVGS